MNRVFHSFEELSALRPRKRSLIKRYERIDVNTPLPQELKDVNTRLREQRREMRRIGLGTVTVVSYSAKIFGVWNSVKESDLQQYKDFEIRKEIVVLDRWSKREISRTIC